MNIAVTPGFSFGASLCIWYLFAFENIILNFFIHYQKQDARIPFVIADVIVIAVLHYVERYMQSQKLAVEQETKKAVNKKHEGDKKTVAALKQAQREEKKRAQQNQKAAPKGGTTHLNLQINMPDKNK